MPTSFLGLPKEIRDQIYTLMFLRLSKILARSGLSGFSQYINLLRVSRQIYPECIIVLYGLNTFLIHCMFGGESQYFMRHVGCQQLRKGILAQSLERRQLCRAWFHLRRMSIMDAHTKPGRLEHLLAFADYFPNLDYLELVYRIEEDDMGVVDLCRLLADRHPNLGVFGSGEFLLKRIGLGALGDISWMISERLYRDWRKVDDVSRPYVWQSSDEIEKSARLMHLLKCSTG
jgi:hypothetical protein